MSEQVKYNAAQFEEAAKIVQNLPKDGPVKPSQDDQLEFYGLFKRAKFGDVDIERPGMLDFAGKAKWDSWKSKEELPTEVAQSRYVEKLLKLLEEAEQTVEVQEFVKRIKLA